MRALAGIRGRLRRVIALRADLKRLPSQDGAHPENERRYEARPAFLYSRQGRQGLGRHSTENGLGVQPQSDAVVVTDGWTICTGMVLDVLFAKAFSIQPRGHFSESNRRF